MSRTKRWQSQSRRGRGDHVLGLSRHSQNELPRRPQSPDLEIRSEQTPSAVFQSVASEIGIPPEGLGNRLDQIVAWLDHNSGADAWAVTPACFVFGETPRSASTRGIVNHAISSTRRSRAPSWPAGALGEGRDRQWGVPGQGGRADAADRCRSKDFAVPVI